MTPTQLALHQEHKARQKRLAEAAQRHRWDKKAREEQAQVWPEPMVTVQSIEATHRREYETTNRMMNYASIVPLIFKVVADEFGITTDDLVGRRQQAKYCTARFIAVGIIMEMTNMSLPAVGRRMNRDHTTILHARNRAREMFANEAIRNRVDQIKARLSA